jgi:dTDP-L-rhamnose 4-epimerase
MRVLITGGGGFVGLHVADAVVDAGHEVVLLDAWLPCAHGGSPARGRHPVVTGDVRDRALVESLLDGVDVVCHQAAMVGHGLDPGDAPDYTANNDHATAVLLAAMYRRGISRLVLASSMVVYGEGRYACAEHGVVAAPSRLAQDIEAGCFDPRCPHCGSVLSSELVGEDAPADPRSIYAVTKLAQEHLAAVWARQAGGTAWALRYHNIYGPRMPRDTPYAGVASIFRSALDNGDAPRVLEDGKQRRDFVHVRDVARANVLALQRLPAAGTLEPVNICSGEPHTIGELASELARACDGPQPRIVGGARPSDVRHVAADPGKARRVLGFAAEIGFAEGMAAFARDPMRESASVGA